MLFRQPKGYWVAHSDLYLTCPAFSQGHIKHGFFTRQGGVSTGDYASLNCGYGSGDLEAHVTQNRTIAMQCLEGKHSQLCTLRQTHSNDVVTVAQVWDPMHAPEADALVTKQPDIALGILTADCVPVLFVDTDAKVIGAAHAGWKGALSGILANTVNAMETLGATRESIDAAIGPCIHQASYEVQEDFAERFVTADILNQQFFVPGQRFGHLLFDLPGYVNRELEHLELGSITQINHDTCAEEEQFFSYRRTILHNKENFGRGLSVIMIKG